MFEGFGKFFVQFVACAIILYILYIIIYPLTKGGNKAMRDMSVQNGGAKPIEADNVYK